MGLFSKIEYSSLSVITAIMESSILTIVTDAAHAIKADPGVLIYNHIHCIDISFARCEMCGTLGTKKYVLYTVDRSYIWSLCDDCQTRYKHAQFAILLPIIKRRMLLVSKQCLIRYDGIARCILCCVERDRLYRGPGMTFICQHCKLHGTRLFCARVSLMLSQLVIDDVRCKILSLISSLLGC